jgi:hypothetical protein
MCEAAPEKCVHSNLIKKDAFRFQERAELVPCGIRPPVEASEGSQSVDG